MKKLLILVFSFATAFALTMPSFAQEAAPAGQEAAPKAEKKEKKEKKAKKGEKRREEGGPEAVTFSFRQSRR